MRLSGLLSVALAVVPWVSALQYHGADYSSLVNLENSGRRYTDAGSSSAFDAILAKHGCNLARIRVWTSTDNTQYSLNYGLALAKRAVAQGMAIMVDLHYSDTWADPGHQAIPRGWPTDLNGLNTQIYTYTNNVVNAFKAQGTPIRFIELGNEINDGMLWPTGQISKNGYSPLSQLLHSAANGVHDADPNVKRMIHLANGWDSAGVSGFYNQIFIAGQLATTDIDTLGFSFYPFYDTRATLNSLKSSLSSIISKLNKDVMVVETDWPTQCSGVQMSEPSIAISAAGQATWVADIRNVLSGLSGGHGLGIIYWEPGWIGNDGLGSSCAKNLLVDDSGNTLSSINMFSADM